MGDSTSSTALTKRKSEEMSLMPPPPPPKRIKRPPVVLDEDVYTDALSHIVARDFFPGLLETQAQQEYLDALDSKDDRWIREAGSNLREAMTPDPYGRRGRRGVSVAQTPASVASTATPGRTPARGSPGRDQSLTPAHDHVAEATRPKVDLTLSLTAFQAKYTSEDNESFNGVLDAQNLARATKYAHLRNHTNKLPSKQQIAQQKVLMARASGSPSSRSDSTALITTPSSSLTMQPPPRPSEDLSLRPASVDSFPIKQGARNTFMFYPTGVEDDLPTRASEAEASSPAPPKSTNFAATRLPGPESERPTVPASPSMSAVDAAIAGRPRLSESERGSEAGDGYTGAETPQVNGWRFVDAEPTREEEALFSDGRGRPIDESEARRQELDDMKKFLPSADAGGGFKMTERSKREELLHRMVERNEAAKRRSTARGVKSERGDLTPAGKSLAGKLGRTPGRTPGGIFGTRESPRAWTPMRTPGVKR
ncbi:Protein DGCR14 [Sphaceloma murrayae]|uniref:Protein DGCR14 n=1 Tax=Sphaceloma murrayae TaxID=2082308 RepID=A0A2K1QH86_9PEZI|nr:Protein DGCR14 [Sphaceloma murrayae]